MPNLNSHRSKTCLQMLKIDYQSKKMNFQGLKSNHQWHKIKSKGAKIYIKISQESTIDSQIPNIHCQRPQIDPKKLKRYCKRLMFSTYTNEAYSGVTQCSVRPKIESQRTRIYTQRPKFHSQWGKIDFQGRKNLFFNPPNQILVTQNGLKKVQNLLPENRIES